MMPSARWIVAALLAVLLSASAATRAQECDSSAPPDEACHHHRHLPLVYSVENTGASYPTPVFPAFAQLPIIRPLPDPFVLFDKSPRDTSFTSWERRRNEIKAAIENYEVGPKPDCSDCTITASYTPPAAGSNTGSLAVVVTRNGKSLTLNERVYIPQAVGNGPFPAMIAMSLAFPPFFVPPVPNYGSLPASVFAGLPIATIDFFHNDVTEYSFFGVTAHTQDPFYQLYPELCAGVCSGTSNSGQYAAWAWGVSRLIDGIEIASHQPVNPLPIDVKHLAVTGCSYAGKMALFAGAFDERVALTIAQENGGGGAPAWRVSHEIESQGSVEDVDDTDYNWFAGQMQQFTGANVYKLPVDHHELMAMVAPRALLETGNTDFYWLSNRSNYISARATQLIYNTLGIADRYGFYIDGGHQHCATLPDEAPAIAAFVGKFMLDQAVSSDVEVNPYPTLDYKRWTWWWQDGPDSEPRFPNDWNSDGTVVMSLDRPGFRPLLVSEGNPVQGSYQLAVGGQHPAATVGVTGAYVETDVKCFDGTSYTLSIPMPEGQTYTIPTDSRLFVPGPTVYQGSATAPACAGGASHGVIADAYFSSLGVANGIGNPPAANGFTTTDTADPLEVTFSCRANGVPSVFAPPITINFQQ
jgi:(4-O-methyl)-D-glucuronate---lignin esterase